MLQPYQSPMPTITELKPRIYTNAVLKRIYIASFSFALIWISTNATNVVAQSYENKGFDTTYSIYYNNTKAGVAERSVSNVNGIVVSTFKVKPTGIFALIGGAKYVQKTDISISGVQAYPLGFSLKQGKASNQTRVKFDWNNRTIKFRNSKKLLSMPSHKVYDLESWYLSLVLEPTSASVGSLISIVEEDRFRTYTHNNISYGTINLKGRSVEALNIQIQDVNQPKRKYEAWVATDYYNLPLRIEKHKGEDALVFEIESFQLRN